jgi:tetratricopeptide (TPR) repeat protein
MTPGNRKVVQKAVAVVVIVALLDMVGVSPLVMLFMTGVAVVIWFASRRSENRDLERIFEFYVWADAILRDEERRWYGFEVAEVIENGERALELMPDSPPLHYFTLGALYYRIGNYEATAEYLSRVTEDELYDELHRTTPSPQLRRYVSMLRRIEYEPSIAPQTLSAVRSLERARRKRAAQLLAESRNFLNAARTSATPVTGGTSSSVPHAAESREEPFSSSRPLSAIAAPPPISEVLQDIYSDENTTVQ